MIKLVLLNKSTEILFEKTKENIVLFILQETEYFPDVCAETVLPVPN